MAGLGVVDVSHIACHVPVLKPNFRPHCSSGQVFASCNPTSFLQQSCQFANSQKSRFTGRIGRVEVTASHTWCRSFGKWYVAQRVNHDRATPRGEGLGRGVRNNWPLSGQCCIVSNFCQQVPRSRNLRVKQNVEVRCDGENASTYDFGNDTVTYSETGEALGQGGGDGAEREIVSPIALENSLTNSSFDDGYQSLRVSEGMFENSIYRNIFISL